VIFKNMKKIILSGLIIVLVIMAVPIAEAQKLAAYQSKWHPGLANDQEEELINQMQLEAKSQFLFMISNDEKNLYVELIVADRAAMQKIMRYGLTTWFNPEAKHKKALGIEFPVNMEGKEEPDFRSNKSGDRKDMRSAMMASKNQEMVLIGFGEKGERKVINPSNDDGFRGKVEMMEGGRLRVSIVVPLDKLQRADIASLANPISLGFETGYMDVTGQGTPSGGGQPSGGGGYGGGMYGGGPGGGAPGGGAPGSTGGSSDQQQRPDISQLASPSRLWIKEVTLATKP
jgi:hypothetical protein